MGWVDFLRGRVGIEINLCVMDGDGCNVTWHASLPLEQDGHCILKWKKCGRPPQYAPAPFKLTFDLLTLKVVSESRVTWATSVPILVFLGLSVLDLGPMYARDRRQTAVVRRASSLNAPYPGAGAHNLTNIRRLYKVASSFCSFSSKRLTQYVARLTFLKNLVCSADTQLNTLRQVSTTSCDIVSKTYSFASGVVSHSLNRPCRSWDAWIILWVMP